MWSWRRPLMINGEMALTDMTSITSGVPTCPSFSSQLATQHGVTQQQRSSRCGVHWDRQTYTATQEGKQKLKHNKGKTKTKQTCLCPAGQSAARLRPRAPGETAAARPSSPQHHHHHRHRCHHLTARVSARVSAARPRHPAAAATPVRQCVAGWWVCVCVCALTRFRK